MVTKKNTAPAKSKRVKIDRLQVKKETVKDLSKNEERAIRGGAGPGKVTWTCFPTLLGCV